MTTWTRLTRRAAVIREARGSELWFAARAWMLAPVVEASLATLDVRRTLRWSTRLPRLRPPGGVVSVDTAARWVDRAYAVHGLRGACLPRALVQHALHLSDGVACRLVVGVRRGAGSLEAHAWVDAGTTSQPSADGFTPLLVTDATGLAEAPGKA